MTFPRIRLGRLPLAVAAFLLLSTTFAASPAAAQAPATWTVLVYMDAEGNLEEYGVDNMLEMEALGTGASARILVQMDRGPGYDERDGDWQGTRRYEIPRDPTPSEDRSRLSSRVIEDMGEINMGDPKTLADFLAWGVQTAPAQRYLVILWDHGGAWDGLAWDHTPTEDHLTLTELRSALDDGRKRANVAAWDVVYFDACVMGSIEVVHAVGPSAALVIASEELVPGAGGSYRAMVEALRESSPVGPEELSSRLVRAFAARYAGDKGTGPGGHECKDGCGTRTFGNEYAAYKDDAAVLSWYVMSKEPALWNAWAALNAKIKEGAAADWPALVKAARGADRFSYEDAKTPSAMDIGDFARRVQESAADPELRALAGSLAAAVDDFVGGYTTSPSHGGATGIMAKFPVPGAAPKPAAGSEPSPPKPDVYATDPEYAAADDAFTALSEAADQGDDEAPTFGDIRVVPQPGGVRVTVEVLDPNAIAVDVAITDEESEFGEVLAWISPSQVEETDEGLLATFEWDGTVFALGGVEHEDGPVIAPAFRESLDAEEYMLEGVFRRGAEGEELDAFLRFDMEGRLLSAWIVEDLASQIRPRPGDAFAPIFLGWEDGEPIDLVDVWVEAAGADAEAWWLESIPLAGGATGFSAYAEDLAGNGALSDPFTIDLPDPDEGEDEPVATPTPTPKPTPTPTPPASPAVAPGATTDDEELAETPGAPIVGALLLVAALAAFRRRR